MIAVAFDYAGDLGVPVVNASLGEFGTSSTVANVIAAHPDTLYIVSAGNDSADAASYMPCNAAAANVVCVGASDNRDLPADFSNFSPTAVDLYAPGAWIRSATIGGILTYANGTSMAAPHVAGAAALLAAAEPGTTALERRTELLSSVDVRGSLAGVGSDKRTAERGRRARRPGSAPGPDAHAHADTHGDADRHGHADTDRHGHADADRNSEPAAATGADSGRGPAGAAGDGRPAGRDTGAAGGAGAEARRRAAHVLGGGGDAGDVHRPRPRSYRRALVGHDQDVHHQPHHRASDGRTRTACAPAATRSRWRRPAVRVRSPSACAERSRSPTPASAIAPPTRCCPPSSRRYARSIRGCVSISPSSSRTRASRRSRLAGIDIAVAHEYDLTARDAARDLRRADLLNEPVLLRARPARVPRVRLRAADRRRDRRLLGGVCSGHGGRR